MRLLLGLPSSGFPTEPFLSSLSALRLPADCIDFERYVVSGNFIPAQRELILTEALARRFDVLAMIDEDIVAPPHALEQLCAALDDPRTALVGGLYYSRDGLRPMAVDEWNGNDTTTAVIPAFDDRSPVVVDGVGFGCTVLRISALQALDQPYLSAHVFIERGAHRVRITDEDYLFCERLRKAGFSIRLHAGVRCGHFDRATNRIIPAQWEDLSATSRRRMYVRTPDGERLLEADSSLPRAHEEHKAVVLDYLWVD